MKKLAILANATLLAITVSSHAAQLFDNGPVVDSKGLSIKPVTDGTFGYSVYGFGGRRVADDFIVTGAGWKVTDISLFAYQPMAVTQFYFQSATWSIVAGDVNTGTVVASGNTTVRDGPHIVAGRRVEPSDLTATTRTIYQLNADIPDVQLAAGTYWLTWGINASENYDGPFTPPTADRRLGNAMQGDFDTAFFPVADSLSGKQYDLPFVIKGSVAAVPEPATAAFLLVGLSVLGVLRRRVG